MKLKLTVLFFLLSYLPSLSEASFFKVMQGVQKAAETYDNNRDVVDVMTLSDDEEVAFGKAMHPDILNELGGEFKDKRVQSYVNFVGQKLVKKSSRSQIPYVFTVTNSDTVNAFALPGGYIYITKSMLYLLENEAELASVLGHEIGHITKRHGVDKMRQLAVANKGAQYVNDKTQAQVLGDLTAHFSSLIIKGYGRSQELQSDKVGVHLMNDTSYDPEAAVEMFEKLKLLEEAQATKSGMKQHSSSHPPTSKRIKQAKYEIKKMKTLGENRNEDEFLKVQERLGY